MSNRLSLLATAGLVCLTLAAAAVRAQEPPKVKIPEPGVPQIMTIEGRYVRAAYNNEGYAILGYRVVQPVGRRAVDAPRGRHRPSRRSAGLRP